MKDITLLYSTVTMSNELVVQESAGSCEHYKLDPTEIIGMSFQLQDVTDRFWQQLPEMLCNSDPKSVYMTFESHTDAVYAFQFSIPMICLDACVTYFGGRKTVLFTATFQTTDKSCVTMCYGTAPSETIASWSFFMLNLRQVIIKVCGPTYWERIGFMSDRHKGLLKGVKKLFPESHHLYCVMHILRNLYSGRMNISQFFDAANSVDSNDFQVACDQ